MAWRYLTQALESLSVLRYHVKSRARAAVSFSLCT